MGVFMSKEKIKVALENKNYKHFKVATDILNKIDDVNQDITQYRDKIDIPPVHNYSQMRHRAFLHMHHFLIKNNAYYDRYNKIPPKNISELFGQSALENILNSQKETLYTFKKKVFAFRKNKEIYGKEFSVDSHTYDDFAPLCISVDTLKALYIPKTVKYIWPDRKLQLSEGLKIKSDVQNYLQLSDAERIKNMHQFIHVRNVTEQDTENNACDIEVVNQKGVFAAQDIPKFTIIGIYSGILLKDQYDMLKLATTLPHNYFQDYLFCISIDKLFPKISAFQYGNSMSLVNSASNYKDSEERIIAEKIFKRNNIIITAVKTNECSIPEIFYNDNMADMLFFIASRDIPKGEQLLYDYGRKYW
jgi:hypothetical protein